ncbi:MAG: CHC2 zinc finger domain-containing protein [Exilibacterium sp.]
MARLPEEVINRIKSEVSLLRLVESQGYTVIRQGKDHVVCCPFHDEKTPSCIISPKTNLFNCFGCGAGGSVIDWVMKTQGVSFRFACEILQKDLGLIQSEAPSKARNTTTKLTPPLAANADNQTALRDVIHFYHETFKQSPEAHEYLRSRGLDNRELIEQFKLGFANRTLGYRLPEKNRKADAELRGKLQEIGILRESGHEHFNGSLVVPITNEQGEITEVYGRKITQGLRKGTAHHLYLPGAHCGVWNHQGLVNQKEVILCEALIDAMTFWVHGFRNVTASYGTSGFTSDHLAAFKQYGVERVLIAYDRDEAGNNAADKLAKQLQQEGFDCYRIELPKSMDVNEYALQVTPASKSLGLVIRKAVWLGTGKPPERQLHIEQQTGQPVVIPSTLAAEPEPEITEVVPVEQDLELPAQAQPEPPKENIQAEVKESEIHFTFGNRSYRVRGLDKNKSYDALKVNILASSCEKLHVDTFDLYASKLRQTFIKVAALEMEAEENTIKADVGKILLKLEQLQNELIQGDSQSDTKNKTLTSEEHSQALELLKSPNLLDRILTDFNRCGVVGEEVNKLVGYLAAGSRKLDKPLAVIIQSTSAAGKSSLMDAVLNLMPEDERVQYSAMTGQSLFYMGETNLKNKILAIAEEEGASNASYALKLLQSEGEITIASTGKDDTSGELVTKEYRVEGPVMLFLTTTAIDIDEELLNRCLVLTVNESREQTRAIHEAQRRRRTLQGLQAKLEKDQLIKLHRNAQKLLKPLAVINPYADQLTFLDDKTRTRRDHEKYLTLIDSIALLHQYQRDIKTVHHAGKDLNYIEVQLSDIETANRLAHEVLGRTLDELPAQTRKLLKLIQNMVLGECEKHGLEQKDFRFSRRDVREFTGWGNTQLKVHLGRLEDMEYLLTHRGSRGQSYLYELLYDGEGQEDKARLMGLIDTEKLTYDKKKSGLKVNKSGLGRPQVGGVSDEIKPLNPVNGKGYSESGQVYAESAL